MRFARGGFLFAVTLIGLLAQSTAVQFAPPSFLQIAASPNRGFPGGYAAIATGDVNGDGLEDIVIQLAQGTAITTLLGDGTGKFARRVDTQVALSTSGTISGTPSLALADFNGDGHLDLVAGTVAGTGAAVQLLIGDGHGHFTAQTTFSTFYGTTNSIVAADLNRDGKMDLVIGDQEGSGVTVFLGRGDGTFAPGVRYSAGGDFGSVDYRNLVVADFNNDGVPDVAFASGAAYFAGGYAGQIATFLGKGDGTLNSATVTPTTFFPDSLSAADVNKDGNLDLIFNGTDTSTEHIYIQLGDGRGRFQAPVSVATGRWDFMHVADVNGDGVPDVALSASTLGQSGPSFSWSILLGSGDGTFANPVVVGADSPNSCTSSTPTGCQYPTSDFALADVNGDHRPDLVFPTTFGSSTSDGTLAVALNATQTRLIITSSSLPAGVINKPYSQTLAATGGTSPYTWSLISGSLPSGLSLSTSGTITGTPTATGTSTFSLQANDSAGATATQSLSITITNGILTISTPSPLVPAAVGLPYSQTLGASGGVTPYSWAVTPGSTPSGLMLSAAGVISGTPSSAGNFGFTVKVTDSSGATAFQAYTLNVIAVGQLTRSGALPHIAAGGGWTTVITLVNTSTAAVAVTVGLHNENGMPLNLAVTTTQQGVTQTATTSSVTTVISPNATFLISTGDQVPSLAVGWADVSSSGPVNGFAIFRTVSSNSPVSEGTVPLQTSVSTTITLPYDDTAGFVMGVALANLSSSAVNVTATIWDESGNQLGTQNLTMAGGGHTSFVLPTQILLTAGKRGIVQFQSSGAIAGLGLRFSPFGTFTSVPTM